MAQKDTKVNIDLAKDTSFLARASKEDSAVMREIAVETKKDSSSMKTVAVLGMLFLPSTLLASLFQAQMVSWDASGRPVANDGFKYFWAVAIPVTFLVVLMWAVATSFPWEKWLTTWQHRSAALPSYA
ncbi:hypothetical protein N431DRAFT_207919 [Stipitochalara longipes BDJ]|nr:hypothetical protein N431DRAFT_207919 [Stipitochalara longipes BDJ]